MRAFAALVLASLMAVAGVTTSAQAAQPADDVVTLTNQQRATAGLAALKEDPTLDSVAQAWASEMSRMGKMEHSTNDWRAARIPAGWFTNGENIAYGYGTSQAVMQDWMGSDGHKKNILRSSYTHIGVGYVASGNYWVQIFAGYDAAKAPSLPPFGAFDGANLAISGATGTLTAGGWAIDRSAPSESSAVHVYVTDPSGAQTGYAITANGSRPDVAGVYPGAGPLHGFSFSQQVTKIGKYQVCAYAIGKAANVGLGCKSASFGPAQPFGSVDTVSVTNVDSAASLSVSGWAMDNAVRSVSTEVHVYVTAPDGKVDGYAVPATSSRPDVAAAYPGAGDAHGFGRSIAITKTGTYQVCIYAIAIPGLGGNNLLTCRSVYFGPAPIGSVDDLSIKVSESGAALSLSGWTLDNGLRSASTQVHAYVTDPSGVTNGYAIHAANAGRTDIASIFPGAGQNHGFSQAIPVTQQGNYRVCVYAIAAPVFSGNNQLVCRTVAFGPGSPVAAFDAVGVDSSRNAVVSGWAFDNALRSAPSTVKFILTGPDGISRETVVGTTVQRPDVAQVFPGTGPLHGFSASLALSGAGTYRACVDASTARVFGGAFTRVACKSFQYAG